jgi:hypothetical protein
MHQNGRALRATIVVCGIAAIAAVSTWLVRTVPTPALPQQPRSAAQPVNAKVPVAPAKGTAVGSVTNASSAFDYKKAFAEAHSYWDYAHRVLPAAKAGNADAQFYLSRVLERCGEDNKMYFQRRGQKIGLDEGLQYAVKRHLSIEVAQAVYDKCHEFQENDSAQLGSPADWLAKATAAGQPLAETTTASKLLVQEMQQNFARAGGVPNPNANPRIENESDPRALFRSALGSRDPEVLFVIGDFQGLLDPASVDASTRRLAWWLVACQRGFDCSDDADWVKNSCGDDAGCRSASSPSDRVRTLAGNQWPDVQQRAQAISAALDAGQWDELGLGSAAAPASNE